MRENMTQVRISVEDRELLRSLAAREQEAIEIARVTLTGMLSKLVRDAARSAGILPESQ